MSDDEGWVRVQGAAPAEPSSPAPATASKN